MCSVISGGQLKRAGTMEQPTPTEVYSFMSRYKLKPLPPDPFRHQHSAIAPVVAHNRKVQRARPLGGLEQAKAMSLASFSPSKIRATAGVTRAQHSLKPLFHQLLGRPINHGHAGSQSVDDPAVTPSFTSFRDIGLQQYPGLQQPLCRAFAFPKRRFKPFAFLAAQPHNTLPKSPSQA
jgi:hypothetical protein